VKELKHICQGERFNPLIPSGWFGQYDVAEALGKITGQDFGKDPARWQEWWEKNKGKFQK
jgi:hypothetical protein